MDSLEGMVSPGIIPFPHTIGSAPILPEDAGKIRGKALAAMREQTKNQMTQIYEQMQVLVNQARELRSRIEVSEKIYMARIQFEPVIGHTYYLYEKDDQSHFLSMISPEEWGRKLPYKQHIASVKLLSDHTWEVLNHNPK